MVINGKERKFRYSVWASGKIAALTPVGNVNTVIKQLENDRFSGEVLPQIACIMNRAYEMWRKFKAQAEGEAYEPDIMEPEEVEILTVLETQELTKELIETMARDSVGEIQTEPVKTKGKKTAKPGTEGSD